MKRIVSVILLVLMLASCMTMYTFAATSNLTKPIVFMGGDHYNIVWASTKNVASIGYVTYTYNGKTYKVYDRESGVVRTDDYIHSVAVPVEHLDAAGSFTAYSQQVTSHNDFNISYSGSASSTKVTGFKGYQSGDSEIVIWTISDIHRTNTTAKYATENYNNMMTSVKSQLTRLGTTPDIIALNGDLCDDMPTKYHIVDYILNTANEILTHAGVNVPVILTTGNHETRGTGAPYLDTYFGTEETGEMYYDFKYGPLSGVVLMSGEDKDDGHYEYGGLNDFYTYHDEETKWLNNEASFEADSTYRIAFSHDPYVREAVAGPWMSRLSELGCDLLVSGHTHGFRVKYPPNMTTITATTAASLKKADGYGGTVLDFPVFEEGGHYDYDFREDKTTYTDGSAQTDDNTVARRYRTFRAGQVKLKNGTITLDGRGSIATAGQLKNGKDINLQIGENITYVNRTDENGKIVYEADGVTPQQRWDTNTKLYSQSLSYSASETPLRKVKQSSSETVVNTQSAVAKTETADTAELTVPTAYGASVSNAVKGGAPSFGFTTAPVVFDTGDYYSVAWATTKGVSATGELYVKNKDGAVRKLVSGDFGTSNTDTHLHSVMVPREDLVDGSYWVVSRQVTDRISHFGMDWSANFGSTYASPIYTLNEYNGEAEVKMLVISELAGDFTIINDLKKNAGSFDVLVLNGNSMPNMNKIDTAVDLLYNVGYLTGGKKPVLFVRGDNENSGGYGAYLDRLVFKSNDGFYSKFEYGPVTAFAFDTSAIMSDNWFGYNGLAEFDGMNEDQYYWLEGESYGNATYRLAFSHSSVLNGFKGFKYSKFLNSYGCDLAMFGNQESTVFTDIGYRGQNYATLTATAKNADGAYATMLTFKNGDINVKVMGASGKSIKTAVISTDDNIPTTYEDVTDSVWYNAAVEYASVQHLMKGTSEDTFEPETSLTRGMAATVIYRLSGVEDVDTKAVFTDVEADKYYTDAVNWAYGAGVVNGVTSTTFEPETALTREQLAAMLYRYMGDKLESASVCEFDDFDAVSDYAKEAVASMSVAGIVNGVGNNTFAPDEVVTRAMLAQVLYKAGL